MRFAKLCGMATVAMLLAARGASGQGGDANISIPLPIQIEDMMTMRRVNVRIATTPADKHAIFDMVFATAHAGSVPAEPWDLLPAKGSGVYEGYVSMPMSGTFYVIGRVEWEDPDNPGMPFSPSDIDYPTRGGFESGFLSGWAKERTDAERMTYAKEVLTSASSTKLEVEVKNKNEVMVKFHQGFKNHKLAKVGFLKDKKDIVVAEDLDKLIAVSGPSPHKLPKIADASGQWWAHGYVKFGDGPNEYLLIRKGPINITVP